MPLQLTLGHYGRNVLVGRMTMCPGANESEVRSLRSTIEDNAHRVGLSARFLEIADPVPEPTTPVAPPPAEEKKAKPKKEKKPKEPVAKTEKKFQDAIKADKKAAEKPRKPLKKLPVKASKTATAGGAKKDRSKKGKQEPTLPLE